MQSIEQLQPLASGTNQKIKLTNYPKILELLNIKIVKNQKKKKFYSATRLITNSYHTTSCSLSLSICSALGFHIPFHNCTTHSLSWCPHPSFIASLLETVTSLFFFVFSLATI
jgi:hypothetical protein